MRGYVLEWLPAADEATTGILACPTAQELANECARIGHMYGDQVTLTVKEVEIHDDDAQLARDLFNLDVSHPDFQVPDTLPNKLGKLLRVALADLLKVEQDPAYTVRMYQWHLPTGCDEDGDENPTCLVCLAGATMAKTLKAPVDVCVAPDMYPPAIAAKLQALDNLRAGNVARAAASLHIILPDEVPEYFKVPAYSTDPKKFHQALGELADLLDMENL